MPLCISVHRSQAEYYIKELRRRGLIDDQYEITRSNDNVLIPVTTSLVSEIVTSVPRPVIVECNPPSRKTTRGMTLPSLDVVGDVVIVREKVLETWDKDELVKAIRQVYPKVRSIFIKEETVDQYRVPVLKLLWGVEVREVTIKEHGVLFKVRLGDVYFNPRLGEEHYRVSSMTRDGERVVDLFSGIGGFAIHIATRRRALVVANDLNPTAYELIIENILLNKRRLIGCVIPLNEDAREASKTLKEMAFDRVIADLPMWSIDYHDIYAELLRPGGMLHLYRLSYSMIDLLDELREVFRGWELVACRLVMEYAPRAGIYRCDLVKR